MARMAVWLPIPSVCAEERSGQRIRARDCLSAASSSETPLDASTAGCPKRSAGTQTVGSPFLCFAKETYPKERRPYTLRPFASLRATCGARVQRGLARTRFAQTIASPDPLAAALLGAS